MAKLDLPWAVVYYWLVASFTGHAHRTVYNKELSSTRSIAASIVQGSSTGQRPILSQPLTSMQPLHASNRFIKFADDTYLDRCPGWSLKVLTRAAELSNIIAWAATNNLKLNKLETKEVVFYDSRRCRKHVSVRARPPCCQWQCADAVCFACPPPPWHEWRRPANCL